MPCRSSPTPCRMTAPSSWLPSCATSSARACARYEASTSRQSSASGRTNALRRCATSSAGSCAQPALRSSPPRRPRSTPSGPRRCSNGFARSAARPPLSASPLGALPRSWTDMDATGNNGPQEGVGDVAVITDIHGNLPGLEAALARIDELGIDRIVCGGDLVGYGPHPNEVVALIAEREIPTVYGNYDYAIARDLEDCGCAYVTPHDRELGQGSVEWTLAHTDRGSKAGMRELPFDLRFDVGATGV